ncbi:putative immunity protein [Microbacterium sp. B35-30]|uniref:putative immunity protein n=1 Tax=Microbacterium sp. B35-30 TaxID=1962642 RepID=UPI0013D18D23|nr:hypothetical protein [Microbacterium sp. B35-30]KAF2420392.1 hypothetical protein B2K11_01575 [Microbacterium sp. B35-30]
MPILPTVRDPRFITIRRGGTLTDEDHRLLAEWAALCAERVLPLFEREQPGDSRPRDAIELGRAWIRGEVPMKEAHQRAFVANAAGKGLPDPAKFAALAAGQAVAVAHVAAHELGAAAYAIRAVAAGATRPEASGDAPAARGGGVGTDSAGETDAARLAERDWQRAQLPAQIRELVLDDQRLRSAICWNVFDD